MHGLVESSGVLCLELSGLEFKSRPALQGLGKRWVVLGMERKMPKRVAFLVVQGNVKSPECTGLLATGREGGIHDIDLVLRSKRTSLSVAIAWSKAA